MTPSAYYYCTLKYVHDPVADESLNIGVILYSPSAPFLDARIDEHYRRLSGAFASFDAEHYRRTVRHLLATLERLRKHVTLGIPGLQERPRDLQALAPQIWPDPDLSFRFGRMLAGLTVDPKDELDHLFTRYVTSQYERPKEEKRSDEEVWSIYRRPLARESVSHRLEPRQFGTSEYSMSFEHAFKNGSWNALRAVSFDLTKAEFLTRKATHWLGYGTELKEDPELGKLYLLLGKPELASNQAAYIKAKNILHKMPVPHELIEEDEAEAFAKNVAEIIRAHDREETAG